MTYIKSPNCIDHDELTLGIVASERDSLIRHEVKAMNQRERLELACRDAVLKLGHSIDDVSEASGLTPAEINKLINSPTQIGDDIMVLSGMI